MSPPDEIVADPSAPAPLATALWWTLRAGAFLCFVGHGAFGLITREGWVRYFAVVGIGRDTAYQLMPWVGTLDILLGTLALVQPRAALLAWMTAWALWTASLRPLSGEPVWEMLERAGNYGVPLALLLLGGTARRWRAWFAPAARRPLAPALLRTLRFTLAATTALLLVGHGALSLLQKPEIVSHYALLGLPLGAAQLSTLAGWFEIGLAALMLRPRSVALCLCIAGWKLATELLFLGAGAPVWEVVERGGSYAAPIALALVLWGERRRASAHRPEVLVEPRERFLDQLRARHVVPAFVHDVLLVRGGGAEEAEEVLL